MGMTMEDCKVCLSDILKTDRTDDIFTRERLDHMLDYHTQRLFLYAKLNNFEPVDEEDKIKFTNDYVVAVCEQMSELIWPTRPYTDSDPSPF